MAGLAGCSDGGDSGNGDEYQEGDNGSNDSGSQGEDESNGSESQDEEQEDEPNPDKVENREEGEDVLEFGDLAIIEHEEEIEEREYGDDQLIISGVVENRDDAKYDSVFVGVRAYNEDGHQLDQYLDSTSDLQGGGTWAFEVTVFDEPAEAISEWDIGVWGHQW